MDEKINKNLENNTQEQADKLDKENFSDVVSEPTENIQESSENQIISEDITDVEETVSLNADVKEKAKRKKKNKKKKKHRGLVIFIVTVLIVGISLALSTGIIYVGKDVFAIDKPVKDMYIDIPAGATTYDIANILYENEIIEYPLVFRTISKISKSDGGYLYGYFLLSPSMSYSDIIDTLQTEGKVKNIVNLTIPEGQNIVEIATVLEQKEICGAEEFLDYINDTEFGYEFESKMSDNSLIFYHMEGYVFPDTYTFYKDENVDDVCRTFLSNFQSKMTDQVYSRMNELGLDLNQLMTLASIIEGESAKTEQMEYISSAFWNRINNYSEYPKWQSNVTTDYINDVIKPAVNKITSKNEKYNATYDAYDSYATEGFPVGPVCNPGMNAITAALYPADTDYLYFCHNPETGDIYYAVTLEEHSQNMITAGLI